MVASVAGTIDTSRRMGACSLVVMVAVFVLVSAFPEAAGGRGEPQISVSEADGVYSVAASFVVSQPPASVRDTLSDYEGIPRFMPEVQTSNVLERGVNRVVVEQEAVARFMMFSKRVHLVLEIEEGPEDIRFRDRCGKSFTRYEGAWVVVDRDQRTEVTYRLVAKPAFEVPGFLLKRLLKRDAAVMISRLKMEIGSRAQAGDD